MATESTIKRVQRRPAYRPGALYYGTVQLVFLAGALVLAQSAHDSEQPELAIAVWVLEGALIARCLFVGVFMTESHIVHRDWFWTRKYPLAMITCISLGRYKGLLQPGYQSIPARAMLLQLDGGVTRRLESTARTPRSANRALLRFASVSGLPICDRSTVDDPD